MLAKILEKQHDATGTGAVVKGPAYKQTSEEVEKLFCILESWDEKGRKEAVSQGDSALTAQVIEELLPNIAAVKAVEPRLDKMYKKAIEPDPDLQTYGPAMKEKVLNLQSRYLILRALAESLETFYDAAATMARESADAAARSKQEQARLQMQCLQQEEQDAIARSMQEKAQQRAQEAAERAAALELESKRREAARVKVEEAETRERAAAAALASMSGGRCIGQAAARWQTDPVTEGAEELTIEMAIQLEEQAAARRSGLEGACSHVIQNNAPKEAMAACETVLTYIRSILLQPRERGPRRIPLENNIFHEKVGRLNGGKQVMVAVGFEEELEEQADEPDAQERRMLVLNRVYIDDLRGAVKLLEGGQALLRTMI